MFREARYLVSCFASVGNARVTKRRARILTVSVVNPDRLV